VIGDGAEQAAHGGQKTKKRSKRNKKLAFCGPPRYSY
jgi:hypothetical protein